MKNMGRFLRRARNFSPCSGLKDGMRRARGSDDDVSAVAGVVEVLEVDGLAVELLGQCGRALVGAIGDKDGSRAVRKQMACGQFAHLPGADQVDASCPCSDAENLLGELDRDRGDGDRRAPTAVSVRTRLATAKARVSKGSSWRVHGSDGAGRGIGFFHLAQNLGLAHDHRIETGRDPEDMADGLRFAKFIDVRLQDWLAPS